ncbi:MAG TPA: GntR family transcriptional regulator, partial [Lentzea sp.]
MRATALNGHAGDRMPSVRVLMARHKASPATVQQAIQHLTAEGLVEVRPGRGSYIAQKTRPATQDLSWQAVALGQGRPGEDLVANLVAVPKPETIPLSSGYLDPDLQPTDALGAALTRAARRPASWGR